MDLTPCFTLRDEPIAAVCPKDACDTLVRFFESALFGSP